MEESGGPAGSADVPQRLATAGLHSVECPAVGLRAESAPQSSRRAREGALAQGKARLIMTMLDRMRRHKAWLKWSLGLVVVAFVALVPGVGMSPMGDDGLPADVLARVGSYEVTLQQFRQVYLRQLQAYRLQTGGEISEEVLRSLGVDRQILQQLIDEYAALAEAERLGLRVSDAEVRERILTLPAFQVDGRFIGEQQYRMVLQRQSPPISTAQFEEDIRRSILIERLQAAVTGWVSVSEAEIADEHRRRTERVQCRPRRLPRQRLPRRGGRDGCRHRVAVRRGLARSTRCPRRRRLRFLLVDEAAIFDSHHARRGRAAGLLRHEPVAVPDAGPGAGQPHSAAHRRRATRRRSRPAPRRSRPALAAARTSPRSRGSSPRTRARPGTAAISGTFGRGRMVPEFEAAAFCDGSRGRSPIRSRAPSAIHVILVTEADEEVTEPFEEVRESIANILKQERASSRARVAGPGDRGRGDDARRSRSRRRRARDTRCRSRGSPPRASPSSVWGWPARSRISAFRMEPGEVAGPIPSPSGPCFRHRGRHPGPVRPATRRGARRRA